ncbi:eRF1 domain 1-domain-containing protein, partial [Neurospora hispaniola]
MRFTNPKHSLSTLDPSGESPVSLLPTTPEDMWHAHNLIAPSDLLRAHAIRKVVTTGSTGSTTSDRVHTDLTIRVQSVFFDPAASSLHVSGTVCQENQYVSLGQHHTLDLELNRPFQLWKRSGWDSVSLKMLEEAVAEDTGEAMCAVVMQEGLANICLITEFQTVVKQRVEANIPKKRAGGSASQGGMTSFYEKTLATLLRTVDFSQPRPLLLASPGFVAQDFRGYMQSEGQKRTDKKLQRMAKDAVVVHSSTGYVH